MRSQLWEGLEQALGDQEGALLELEGAVVSGPQLLHLAGAAATLVQRALSGRPARDGNADTPRILAIYLTNSAAYVVAVLAALRLGLAFLPLDPAWPERRLHQVCDEAAPLAVVWTAEGAPGGHGEPLLDGSACLVQLPELAALAAQHKQEPGGGAASQRGDRIGGSSGAFREQSDPAAACCYLLYTSGSTGRPLGVLGTERGVLNRCRWMQQAWPFQAGDRVAFKTSPCFVDSVWEVLGPLLGGAALVPVPQATTRDPEQLLRLLGEQRITHLAAVPTVWRVLAACARRLGGAAPTLRLRLAVSSGEPLPAGLLVQLRQLLPPGCRLLNLYGSTEVAADCTAFDCTGWQPAEERMLQPDGGGGAPSTEQERQAATSVPVGQPISGALVAVLGPEPSAAEAAAAAHGGPAAQAGTLSQRAVLPLGAIGEVAVAGAVVAAGYLAGHPAAAAAQRQSFTALPTAALWAARQAGGALAAGADLPACFWEAAATPCFLTGDLGWLDAGGCLRLAGRRDLQVKLAGVRVDLSEVEAALAEHPAVAAAAARMWQLPAGPVVEGYVELRAGQQAGSADSAAAPGITSTGLREWLRQRLPAAAVPQHVTMLPALPRSAGGKVQRSELPPPLAAAPADEGGLTVASLPALKRQRTAGEVAAAGGAAAEQPPLAVQRLRQSEQPRQRRRRVSELEVSRAFAAALGHADFEATTSLFAIGGTSLTAAEVAGRVAGGRVEAVLRHPTVRSLAAFLSAEAAADGAAAAAAGGGASNEQQQEQQQEAAAAPAPLPFLPRQLDSNSVDGRLQAPRQAGPWLRLSWSSKLLQCVDAAPLLVPGAAPPHGVQQQVQQVQQQQSASCVYACSHGGDVCCFDLGSGRELWRAQLPDRADAGLALCCGQPLPGSPQQQQQQPQPQQYLVVATNDGTLHFLHSASGVMAGSLATGGGGIRAPPTIDPWTGLVWQPTHGRQLVVASAPGREVARLVCPAAVSAAVAFAPEQRLAFVCCLDGSLLAVRAEGEPCGSSGLQLSSQWQWRSPAPLFAPAAVAPGGGSVLVAGVDGSVTALDSSSGSVLWRAAVRGAVFSPPLTLHAPRPVLLVVTQAGQLSAIDLNSGQLVGAAELGDAITGLRLLPAPSAGTAGRQLAAACLACGAVVLLDLVQLLSGGSSRDSSSGGDGTSCVCDAVQLPGGTFAPPAAGLAAGGGGGVAVAVGCRDDRLYCFEQHS